MYLSRKLTSSLIVCLSLLFLSVILVTGVLFKVEKQLRKDAEMVPWCGTVSFHPNTSEEALGEYIFQSKCTSCHSLNKNLIAPALRGIGQRRSEDWLTKWIKNPEVLIESGDSIAVEIANFQPFPCLTPKTIHENEIQALISYLDVAF